MNSTRTDYSSYKLNPRLINPYWLLGFVEGEASFICKGQACFSADLSEANLEIIDAINNYFISEASKQGVNDLSSHVGRSAIEKQGAARKAAVKLKITGTKSLTKFIIPYFHALRPYYQTRKQVDFERFMISQMANLFGYKSLPNYNDFFYRIKY